MAKEIFDYSKVSPNDYAYYGFHLKNGRYHIDTKRLKKLHCDDSFPDGLFNLPRNTHYFLPKHKFEKEWAINVLKAYLNKLSSDWNKEFKTVISKITTPKEVKDDVIINLASKEYSKCIEDYLESDVRLINIDFVEEYKGKLVTKATYAKMARGEMVRYMAENRVEDINMLKSFNRMNYQFKEELSDDSNLVFERKK